MINLANNGQFLIGENHIPTLTGKGTDRLVRSITTPRTRRLNLRQNFINFPEIAPKLIAVTNENPNLIPVHSIVTDPQFPGDVTINYIYQQGATRLDQLCNELWYKMICEDLITTTRQLFAGPKAIHEAGLLHKDIKISNYWLHMGRILLGDFETLEPAGLGREQKSPYSQAFNPHDTLNLAKILNVIIKRLSYPWSEGERYPNCDRVIEQIFLRYSWQEENLVKLERDFIEAFQADISRVQQEA
ncbi:MAG: hypothetical protein JNK26_03355 [Candidatus Doudnabacteria bacterium]|nr:hypothetical protein [Candidatus Doudnabacteria bacterium]